MASKGVKNWRGDEARQLIRAEITRRMKAACIVVSRYAKELVNTDGRGVFKEELAARQAKQAKRK